jgi:omega-6 fatty acid desaturase (delta-12 desaturase)
LKGKALSIAAEDFPKSKDIKAVIPADCFAPETAKSLGYLSVSLVTTALCTAVGVGMVGAIGTSLLTLPIWAAYSTVTGTVAMGLWVLAHECGESWLFFLAHFVCDVLLIL